MGNFVKRIGGCPRLVSWVPHVDRGAAMPSLSEARNALKMFSLWDTYEHA